MSTKSLDVGHVLGSSFRIAELLTTTDFAVSYRVTREGSDEPLLLRTFDLAAHLPESSLPMIRKRFINEARQLEKLEHRGLEEVLGAGDEGSSVFLVTRTLDAAERLDATIARGPRREESVRILKLILEALGEAHRQGHPHRDLTPSRIRLLTDGTVKVTDFGLVKLLHTLRGTQQHALPLTPYSPPEVVQGEEIGAPADLYAVGAIAWELFTGGSPFTGSPDELREAIVGRPPSDGAAALPEPLRAFLGKALEKDPALRFADAESMSAALVAATQDPDKVDLGPAADSLRMAEDPAPPARAAAPPTASAPPAAPPPPAPPATPSPAPAAPRAAALPTAPPGFTKATAPSPRGVAAEEPDRDGHVLVVRKGPPPALVFGIMGLAAVGVTLLALPWLRPQAAPATPAPPSATSGEPEPTEEVVPVERPRLTPSAGSAGTPSLATTPSTEEETAPAPGLVHSFEATEAPPVQVKNPLDGVDVSKLTRDEKEGLVQQLVEEVRLHVRRGDPEASRTAKNNLDAAAPDDARFYELETQVLNLAIERPPAPKEGEEVSLMRVDQPPALASHKPPAFPKRPPAQHREVIVKALVDEHGDVAEIAVLKDDEYGSGAIAAQAVRSWTFEPASAEEVKVKVWIAIPIRTGGEWEKPQFQVVGE